MKKRSLLLQFAVSASLTLAASASAFADGSFTQPGSQFDGTQLDTFAWGQCSDLNKPFCVGSTIFTPVELNRGNIPVKGSACVPKKLAKIMQLKILAIPEYFGETVTEKYYFTDGKSAFMGDDFAFPENSLFASLKDCQQDVAKNGEEKEDE